MLLTRTTKPNHFLPDLFRVAFWVGTTAASSVMLFGATHGSVRRDTLDWRYISLWGTIGVLLGTHYGITQRPWFNS